MTNPVLIDLGRAYLCLNCDAIVNWAVCCSRCGFDVLLPLVSAIPPQVNLRTYLCSLGSNILKSSE